jgi:hypothetical protein
MATGLARKELTVRKATIQPSWSIPMFRAHRLCRLTQRRWTARKTCLPMTRRWTAPIN